MSAFAERDGLGRRIPTKMGIHHYLLVIARADPSRVRRVPDSGVEDQGSDEDGAFAFVDCPCSSRPVVRDRIAKCPGCERWYVYIEGRQVYVTYGEMAPPPIAGP